MGKGIKKMGRPKGSKNKKDLKEVKEIPKGIEVKEGIPPNVSANTKKVEAATKFETWTATPDMGKVKEPSHFCSCEHARDLHYGGSKGWCNYPNCRCEEWKN